MTEKKFHQRLLDSDDMTVDPVDRLLEEQSKRRARLAAQSKSLKIEKQKRKDATEKPQPAFWQRLMAHAGVMPPADSFRQRLLDRLEGKR